MKLSFVRVALDDRRCTFLHGLTLPTRYFITNSFVNNKMTFGRSIRSGLVSRLSWKSGHGQSLAYGNVFGTDFFYACNPCKDADRTRT
jgi:hypothetical protein